MKFILSQELSRHNRDRKCHPIEQQMDYKTYEISYETIEILPSYTIIASSDSVTANASAIDASKNSEIFLIPPISNENDFDIQEPTDQQDVNVEDIGTVKSWNCGLCTFK